MNTATRIQATPENPQPLPPHGGNWVREHDGSLTLLETTQDKPAEPAGEPAAKPGSKKQPTKE